MEIYSLCTNHSPSHHSWRVKKRMYPPTSSWFLVKKCVIFSNRIATISSIPSIISTEAWLREKTKKSSEKKQLKQKLVCGWSNPSEKYDRQIGFIFPKLGWKSNIFELPPPRKCPVPHLYLSTPRLKGLKIMWREKAFPFSIKLAISYHFPEITSGDWRVLSGITLLNLGFTFARDIIGCWFLLPDVCLGELYFCNSDLTKFGFWALRFKSEVVKNGRSVRKICKISCVVYCLWHVLLFWLKMNCDLCNGPLGSLVTSTKVTFFQIHGAFNRNGLSWKTSRKSNSNPSSCRNKTTSWPAKPPKIWRVFSPMFF